MLDVQTDGPVLTLTLNRPERRNAMSDDLLARIDAALSGTPEGVKVAVIRGAGGHFCSGLDLSEHVARRDAEGVMRHSRGWHAVLDRVQYAGLPVVAAMTGAVIGGGLELATACHVRVADPTAFYQLPEGRRGIFVGGGATVRVGRILGPDRMTEMMLTGRRYGAEEGQRLGLSHELTDDAWTRADELARDIAGNAPLSNFLMIQALPRIGDMGRGDGLFTESLCAALAQTSPEAIEGLEAFLQKRAPRFGD